MPDNRMEYHGFNLPYDGSVRQLITEVKIAPAAGNNFSGVSTVFKALWDTGATVTCASLKFRDCLKLQPVKLNNAPVLSGLTSDAPADLTFVNIFLTDDMKIERCPVYVADFDDEDFDIIIGMDIITMGDFAVCSADGKTSFSFAMPPFPDRIDLADKADAANRQSRA